MSYFDQRRRIIEFFRRTARRQQWTAESTLYKMLSPEHRICNFIRFRESHRNDDDDAARLVKHVMHRKAKQKMRVKDQKNMSESSV
jgi:hypothetical protein